MKKAITLVLALSFCAYAVQAENHKGKSAAKSATGTRAARQCTGAQLSLTGGDEDAAMGGVRSREHTFTNTSSSPCTLKGYPGFVLLNKAGHPVPGKHSVNKAKMFMDTDPVPPKLVTLEPGKTAVFFIYYNNGGAGRTGPPCPTYPKVRVTAPGTTKGFVLKEDIETCIKVEVSSIREPASQ